MTSLNARAWLICAIFAIGMGALLFVPAGTLHYWQAWVYLLIVNGATCLITLYLVRHDPALLERRIRAGARAEVRPAQRLIMRCMSVGFVALLVVPAVGHRIGGSAVPLGIVLLGDLAVATGYFFIYLVYRVNTFTSATIEVADGQRVISSGPYAIVRHPMYASALLILAGTPLALGSYWGLVVLGPMLPLLLWRIFDEETLLSQQLPEYRDYQRRVRHRLLPLIW
jgi:protein-S-isoprenylcysteine O-methyltransferase Ste14